MDEQITHDEAAKRLENAAYFLSGQPDAACLGIDKQDGHPYRDEMAASLLMVRDFILSQQRAASGVRVVKILDENNADEVSSKEEYWHDLPPHTALAIIEPALTPQETKP